MNISRSEIISAVAAALAGVAAVSSVISASSTPKTVGVADFELGKTTQVEDWSYTGANNFNRACSITGNVTYEVEGPKGITGAINGQLVFEHGREWVSGTMIDGEGTIRVNVSQFNSEDVCDLKKASDLEVESIQLDVTPAIVSAID
jgi:hypothetical protein